MIGHRIVVRVGRWLPREGRGCPYACLPVRRRYELGSGRRIVAGPIHIECDLRRGRVIAGDTKGIRERAGLHRGEVDREGAGTQQGNGVAGGIGRDFATLCTNGSYEYVTRITFI